jgi:ferredoxin-type protein NapH
MKMNSFLLRLAARRGWVQAFSALAMNSYVTQNATKGVPCLGLNCYACPTAAFACPIGALQNFAVRRTIPLYVLGVVGLAGVLIGRASCGWLCPFGWLQDLLYRIKVPKLRLPNRFNWTRYVVLAVLVFIIPYFSGEPWFSKLCPAGTLEAGIPMLLLAPELRSMAHGLYAVKIAILASFLGWMTVTKRPFCRWVCPLGAMWSPFNPVSTFRLEVNDGLCKHCNHCQEVCPTDINIYDNPNSSACIRCLACARECPQNAIRVTTIR